MQFSQTLLWVRVALHAKQRRKNIVATKRQCLHHNVINTKLTSGMHDEMVSSIHPGKGNRWCGQGCNLGTMTSLSAH